MSRYLYGIDFPPRDLRLALVEAADGKIGTKVDQFCSIATTTIRRRENTALRF